MLRVQKVVNMIVTEHCIKFASYLIGMTEVNVAQTVQIFGNHPK